MFDPSENINDFAQCCALDLIALQFQERLHNKNVPTHPCTDARRKMSALEKGKQIEILHPYADAICQHRWRCVCLWLTSRGSRIMSVVLIIECPTLATMPSIG